MAFHFILFFTSFFFVTSSLVQASIDLEMTLSNFILETKRIEIPDHPHAFNPSIVNWNGGFLLSFREIKDSSAFPESHSAGLSNLGLVRLDQDFNVCGKPQILNDSINSTISPFAADARLVMVGNELYIAFSDQPDSTPNGECRMCYGKVKYDGVKFSIEDLEFILFFEGENSERPEKNWVPFNYKGNLLFAYSLSPHKILQSFFGSNACYSLASTQSDFKWNWGELRGGTPALKIDRGRYLSFFHSSKKMASIHSNGTPVDHYFMGAYIFSASYPFAITQMSDRPIIGTGFYKGKEYAPYWKPVCVVFPCGILQSEEYVWVSYGRQDHEMWIMKLDKKLLLDSLQDIQ